MKTVAFLCHSFVLLLIFAASLLTYARFEKEFSSLHQEIKALSDKIDGSKPRNYTTYMGLALGHYKVTTVLDRDGNVALIQGPGAGAEEKLVIRVPLHLLSEGTEFLIDSPSIYSVAPTQ